MTMPEPQNIPVEIARETLGEQADDFTLAIESTGELSITHCKTKKNKHISLPIRSGAILDAATTLAEEKAPENSYILGKWLYRAGNRSLEPLEKGESKDLTDKEVSILNALIECQNGLCSRQSLLEDVWGYKTELETHTLETHIYRLRQKLENDPNAPEILLTAESSYKLVFSTK